MISYLISYDDYTLVLDKIKEIHQSLPEYEEDTIDLDDEGLYSLVDEMTTVSLFSSSKLIIVKNASNLANTKSEDAKKQFLTALHDPDNLNCLVLLFSNTRIDDSDFMKNIKKASSYISVKFKDVSLDTYALESLNKDGYTIDKDALTKLINNSPSIEFLATSINKLKCYKLDEKNISSNDVDLMVSKPLDTNVYDLVNSVILNDKTRVFEIYNDLKKGSITSSYLVALLLAKFQEMYNVSILLKARLNQQDIASLYKVTPGRAYYMIKNTKITTMDSITKNLDLLNDLDLKIKQGLMDQNLGLELYLLR